MNSKKISERAFEDSLEAGKTIIVTTLQKFPVIAEEAPTATPRSSSNLDQVQPQ